MYEDTKKQQFIRADLYLIISSALSKFAKINPIQIPSQSQLTEGVFVHGNVGYVFVEKTLVKVPYDLHTTSISLHNQLIYVADWKHFRTTTFKLGETSKQAEKVEQKENTIVTALNSQLITITKQNVCYNLRFQRTNVLILL